MIRIMFRIRLMMMMKFWILYFIQRIWMIGFMAFVLDMIWIFLRRFMMIRIMFRIRLMMWQMFMMIRFLISSVMWWEDWFIWIFMMNDWMILLGISKLWSVITVMRMMIVLMVVMWWRRWWRFIMMIFLQ